MGDVWVWNRNDDDGTPRGVFTSLDNAKSAVRRDYAGTGYTVEFHDSRFSTYITVTLPGGHRYPLDNGIKRIRLDWDRIAGEQA